MKIDTAKVTKKLVKTRVRVSAYNGNVRSDDGQKELAESNNAEKDSVIVGVSMFPKEIQKKIRDHTSGIRQTLRKASLPFQDGGYRILNAKNYPKLRLEILKRREDFRTFVYDEIVLKHDEIKQMAETRLGTLFDSSDFPDQDKIMDRFDAVIFCEPIQDLTDLRIEGLTENELEQIKSDTIAEYEAGLKSAQMELVSNLRKAVDTIKSKTANESSRYKRALANLADVCDSVADLNILEDENLTKITEAIKVKIASKDSDTIKENETVKAELKKDSIDLIDALDQITF